MTTSTTQIFFNLHPNPTKLTAFILYVAALTACSSSSDNPSVESLPETEVLTYERSVQYSAGNIIPLHQNHDIPHTLVLKSDKPMLIKSGGEVVFFSGTTLNMELRDSIDRTWEVARVTLKIEPELDGQVIPDTIQDTNDPSFEEHNTAVYESVSQIVRRVRDSDDQGHNHPTVVFGYLQSNGTKILLQIHENTFYVGRDTSIFFENIGKLVPPDLISELIPGADQYERDYYWDLNY